MSVPEQNRRENLNQVFVKAADLLAYVTRTMCNPKHCPVRYQKINGDACIDLARQIMHDVWTLNEIRGIKTTNTDDAILACRLHVQTCFENLKSELNMNLLEFGLTPRKAKEWSAKMDDFLVTYSKWIHSFAKD